MALVQEAKVDLVSSLNREVATALDSTGLIFSRVQPSNESGESVKLRLTALNTYTYRGTRVIEYHRRNLADLPSKLAVTPRMEPKATLYEQLLGLRDSAGINFSQDDVEDAPVTAREDGLFEVQLTAKAGSLNWYGTVRFVFQNLPPITLAIKEYNLAWS
ncbi:hypothetical protein D3C76_25950 [compost metagenome]